MWRLLFVTLGCLLHGRRTLDTCIKIQNNFAEVIDVIPLHVGRTKIIFWSVSIPCFFHNVRYAVAILVITHTFTRRFTSAMSCKQSVCCVISCSSVFNCWLDRWAFHVFVVLNDASMMTLILKLVEQLMLLLLKKMYLHLFNEDIWGKCWSFCLKIFLWMFNFEGLYTTSL